MHAAVPCDVELQSVGYWETESSYVKINGMYVLQLHSPANEHDEQNPSGMYTVLLDKVALPSVSYIHVQRGPKLRNRESFSRTCIKILTPIFSGKICNKLRQQFSTYCYNFVVFLYIGPLHFKTVQ